MKYKAEEKQRGWVWCTHPLCLFYSKKKFLV